MNCFGFNEVQTQVQRGLFNQLTNAINSLAFSLINWDFFLKNHSYVKWNGKVLSTPNICGCFEFGNA